MPTQNEYTQAVLKAQLVNADSGNAIVLKEMSGCECDWSGVLCQFRQIQGASFCLEIGDYVSATALYFYNTMLDIVGLNYPADVVPDPNAQLPSGIVVNYDSAVDLLYNENYLIDAGGGNWYLPLVNSLTNSVPPNAKPVLLTLNGDSFTPTYSTNFTPTRLYGFASNAGPQTIVLTVVAT